MTNKHVVYMTWKFWESKWKRQVSRFSSPWAESKVWLCETSYSICSHKVMRDSDKVTASITM